jgi:hypothetical protein
MTQPTLLIRVGISAQKLAAPTCVVECIALAAEASTRRAKWFPDASDPGRRKLPDPTGPNGAARALARATFPATGPATDPGRRKGPASGAKRAATDPNLRTVPNAAVATDSAFCFSSKTFADCSNNKQKRMT